MFHRSGPVREIPLGERSGVDTRPFQLDNPAVLLRSRPLSIRIHPEKVGHKRPFLPVIVRTRVSRGRHASGMFKSAKRSIRAGLSAALVAGLGMLARLSGSVPSCGNRVVGGRPLAGIHAKARPCGRCGLRPEPINGLDEAYAVGWRRRIDTWYSASPCGHGGSHDGRDSRPFPGTACLGHPFPLCSEFRSDHGGFWSAKSALAP